jgi:glucokinase
MELLRQARTDLGIVPIACGVAVAGPVSKGKGGLTNGTLEFDALEVSCGLACLALVLNDFVAIASALPVLTGLRAIGSGVSLPSGVKALIGPGTGLGMSFVVPPSASAGWGWGCRRRC